MPFLINRNTVQRGSKGYTRIKIAPMLDGNEISVPVHIVHGEKPGPVLGLFAGIHGSEYYQNRVIRRIVCETKPDKLIGTVVAVPVANPYAFSHASRQTPLPNEETVDFANLNRVFPGKRLAPLFGSMVFTDVSLTMRIAQVITDHIVKRCTHIIDFHGQMKGMALRKMLFNLNEKSMKIAKEFGLGVLHDPADSVSSNSTLMPMTDYAGTLGIPAIIPELGGGGHGESFEKTCEDICVHGTRNIMIHLGMIEGTPSVPEIQFYFVNAPHVRSMHGGYLVTDLEAWDVGVSKEPREVRKGERLGVVYGPYSFEELEIVRAPCDGLIYACRVSGLVEPYSEILAVADFEGSKWIE
jgi:predicted deacylase